MPPPLAGIRVLDFTTLLPGPLATLLLAEAGAEVVKIERPPAGDEMRGYAPRWGADSANFALLNRGKCSLTLDLKDPAQRAQLDPWLERADVLVEQFRPGVMERLGLGWAALSARHPRLIYCSITGYGQDGPKGDVAGHDLNYIGDTGLLSVAAGDPQHPTVPPALVADIAAGAYPAFMNILLALMARTASGRGSRLDVAMTDHLFPFLYWAIGAGLTTGRFPGNADALTTGGTARYRLYPAADGRLIAVAAIEQRFWERFCALIGLEPALIDDAADPPATIARIAALLRARPAAAWRAIFAGQDCCCSVVATVAEALSDPHVLARGLFARTVTNADGAQLPALPVPVLPAFRRPETDLPSPTLAQPGAVSGMIAHSGGA